ncbi:hypothetical protein [Wenyingzhuangia aestuarii]|uniref:hypothetical protein n=1 Tax=Wenyingzhuangia aestuarii TaxID=1647582 RepID=UPI00143BA526|nr:hypothetical protein [Wenyingzhuangia aestuarii]NJB83043.1 hypothetical protein [Wenyingzhuangia aestuarii]
MKNKIKLTLIALSTFIVGCTTGGYDSPDDFSDVGFYTSEGTSQILEKNIYDYMTFADLSLGEVKHAWTIQTGNAFLKGPIERVPNNLESLIINDGDTVSNAKTVSVLFRKSGLQKVRLYNEFRDSVAFRGHRNGEDYEMASVQVGNKWVIDTTFVVKVYDTIIAELEVRQDGAVVNHKSTDTIYVEAGGSLNFIDKTTIGEPTGRNFFVRRPTVEGDPNSGQNVANSAAEDATLLLKKLGVFVGGITANRTGETTPGDSDTYIFPAPIKVIPSTQPFQLTGNIRELENETIQIPFNGEFVEFTNKEAFFEVKVNGTVFPIESVSVDETDATFINIKLIDPIYQDDDITVTWLENSGIESTDTRVPVVFTDAEVTSFVEKYLVSIGQFESSIGVDWVKETPNESIDAITEVLIVDAPSSATPSTVTPSGKVINLAINRDKTGTQANNVRADTKDLSILLREGKDYEITFKYLVRSGSLNILFRFDNAGGANQLVFNPQAGTAANVDVWKEGSVKFKALKAHQGKFGILSAWGNYSDFYVDDIVIMSNETRP